MTPHLPTACLILTLLSSLSEALPQSGFSRRNVTGVDAADAPAAPGALVFTSYTAIGDSYASGPGPGAPVENDPNPYNPRTIPAGVLTNSCWRTKDSYPFQFRAANIPASTFQFLACNGAKTFDIKNQTTFNTGPTLGVSFTNFGTPDLVTISAGGNNGDLLRNIGASCFFNLPGLLPGSGTCNQDLATGNTTVQNIVANLTDLYTAAATKNLANPNANRTVAVTGYARFFGRGMQVCMEPILPGIRADCFTDNGPCKKANDLVSFINRQIQASITTVKQALRSTNPNVKLVFVDIDPSFEGRRICDVLRTSPQAGFQVPDMLTALGLFPNLPASSPFHPTRLGYNAMASALATVLART